MKTLLSRKMKSLLIVALTSFVGMLQFQNCAKPVSESASSSDPAYTPVPITGSQAESTVSINNNPKGQIMFAESDVELTANSDVLRPGGICSMPDSSQQIQWMLQEDKLNSQILIQGAEACSQGSFYVDLSAQLANLECDKSYVLSASLVGQGTTNMSIKKQCESVAASN